ncbi:hypothetical protein JW805_15515 [Roseomonas aeriglobus]|nr:hypothetical protein [Roseomonas aeriglobus]
MDTDSGSRSRIPNPAIRAILGRHIDSYRRRIDDDGAIDQHGKDDFGDDACIVPRQVDALARRLGGGGMFADRCEGEAALFDRRRTKRRWRRAALPLPRRTLDPGDARTHERRNNRRMNTSRKKRPARSFRTSLTGPGWAAINGAPGPGSCSAGSCRIAFGITLAMSETPCRAIATALAGRAERFDAEALAPCANSRVTQQDRDRWFLKIKRYR